MCHLCRCSSPTVFAPQGPDLAGQTHMESPSGNATNNIHDYQKVKGGDWLDLTSLNFGLELNGGTSHTSMFSRGPE